MNLLPQSSGHRPRLACEIFAGGVVVARSVEPGVPLAGAARVELAEGAVLPSLKPGNVVDRVAVIAGLRRGLEHIGCRPNARKADLTLVIPDGSTRVLLLDFDALPNKLSEALPIVRFRLKKLVPFETDDAMVSFQVMSSSRSVVRVLAVAIPRDVLSEYESVAREAGFEPGAVLPSTLAVLAGVNEAEGASMIVNAGMTGVTTAIVRSGILLLHRTVELTEGVAATPANLPPALFERSPASSVAELLPLVDREDTAGEWAAQEPLPEFGRNPYADGISAERGVEDGDGAPGLPGAGDGAVGLRRLPNIGGTTPYASHAIDSMPRFPYASPTVAADLNADWHNAVLDAPTTPGTLTEAAGIPPFQAENPVFESADPPVHTLAPDLRAEEVAQAVSVAVAYFEDNLGTLPETLLSAGPLGAERLNQLLAEQGVSDMGGLRVRELVEAAVVGPATSVPRGWLSGVVGALRS